jgi:hypothetical protein
MWREGEMAKRLDWEKRKFDGVPKLSIKDEAEFRQGDAAARWLAKAEECEARRKRLAKAQKERAQQRKK